MANGNPGRPYIGQKVQAQVPDWAKEWVRRETELRDVPEAEVVRDVFMIGLSSMGVSELSELGGLSEARA
jgi:hypothetical protein